MGAAESKSNIRSHFVKLGTEDISVDDDQYWDVLFNCKTSLEDLVFHISPNDVRGLRHDRLNNLICFHKRLILDIKNIIDQGYLGVIPYEKQDRVINGLRLFSRVFPFILEDQNNSELVQRFWMSSDSLACSNSSFESNKDVSNNSKNNSFEQEVNTKSSGFMSLGAQLLTSLVRLLFSKNFTIIGNGLTKNDEEILPKHKVDSRYLWGGKIGTSTYVNETCSTLMIQNRTELLRCIIICLSDPLFQTVQEYGTKVSPWLRVVTSGALPHTANLFCSLISVIFGFDPVGYGVPYGSYLSSSNREFLVEACVQLLVILLDFNPPKSDFLNVSDIQPSEESNHTKFPEYVIEHKEFLEQDSPDRLKIDNEKTNKSFQNVYRTMLSGLKKESEFEYIFNGFVRLLETCPNSFKSYLPRSSSMIPFYQEFLVLLWHFALGNMNFLRRVCSCHNTNRLLSPLLFLLIDASSSRNELVSPGVGEGATSKVGLLHLCSFILLLFSSEREFAVKLNEPIKCKFSFPLPPFRGCYADLLFLVCHRVIMDSVRSAANDSLIDMLLTIMSNVSAYIKSLCMESCVKLLNLLERFSRPSWIYKAPFHYHDLFFLLDMFNNLIQYQYEGNQNLIYSILRQKEIFDGLKDMKFTPPLSRPKSIDEIEGAYDDDDEENMIAQTWIPTTGWFDEWKSKLPLQTISKLIKHLLPIVEKECQDKGLIDQYDILEYLQRTTMVGLLPVPHPIVIRNYQPNTYTALWFSSFMWGIIFSRSRTIAFFDYTKIKLILINPR